MKKLIALGLLVSSLMGTFGYADEAVKATKEVVEELNIQEIKKEVKKQIILEAKAAGKELTEEELDEAVDAVLNMLAYLAEQQEETVKQEATA